MTITEIRNKEDFNNFLLNPGENYKYILVEFYYTNCLPCNLFTPQLERLNKTFNTIKFLKINSEKFPELVTQYKLGLMPSTIIFEKGKSEIAFQPIIGAYIFRVENLLKMITEGIKTKEEF